MKRSNAGFTLIELLVVIAIIAILAAILFPVFARAREKARQSSCLSNLKQMALAVNMYNQDYDGTYPAVPAGVSFNFVDFTFSGTPTATQNYGLLVPYTKNQQIFQCPSQTATAAGPYGAYYVNAYGRGGDNGGFNGGSPFGNSTTQNSDSQVDGPTTIMFFCGAGPSRITWMAGTNDTNTGWPSTWEVQANDPAGIFKHGSSTNFAYGDGHCKSQNPLNIVQGDWTSLGTDNPGGY